MSVSQVTDSWQAVDSVVYGLAAKGIQKANTVLYDSVSSEPKTPLKNVWQLKIFTKFLRHVINLQPNSMSFYRFCWCFQILIPKNIV